LRQRGLLILLLIFCAAFVFSGCHKKEPIPEPMPATQNPPTTETPPPAPMTEQPGGEGTSADLFEECTKQLQPVFFDYNRSDVREDQIPALQNNASVLKNAQCGAVTVLIEGHCDERGTDEYNLALGERRADAAKDYMVNLGIPENRLSTLSYGESRPFALGHNEDAWAQNRRAHFVAVRK
jgi:peptidoglycan-associated lipoprotein